MTEADDLLRAGDLGALRALYATRARAEPARAAHRLALAEVLILQGELERADAQLDIAAGQDDALALPVALTRQLIRAAAARDDCFTRRRPPEQVAEPDAGLVAALARLAGAEVLRDLGPGELRGTLDDRAFEGIRDADDRTAEVLEVLTTTGKYVWVSLARVASVVVHPPERPRDIVWRRAELDVRDGPSGIVYLPAIYHAADMTDAQRLGRETDWVEEGDLVRGVGLRTFLAGDEAVAFGEFGAMAVDA